MNTPASRSPATNHPPTKPQKKAKKGAVDLIIPKKSLTNIQRRISSLNLKHRISISLAKVVQEVIENAPKQFLDGIFTQLDKDAGEWKVVKKQYEDGRKKYYRH